METYLIQITNYLLTQSWQIAILVVVIAAVNLALKNRSAHVRYLLWLIVLAKCLAPPLLTVPVAVLPQEKYAEPAPVSPIQAPTESFEIVDTPITETPVPLATPIIAAPQITVVERQARLTASQWFSFGWLAGVAAFLLFAATKAVKTEFWLRRQRKMLSSKLQAGIEDLFSRLELKTFPKVWLIEGIGQPFVWGLLRGSIYLPADFIKVNSIEHRRDVLSHELSHILRFDAAVNILQVIAQAIFWFHPFVWWANKKIRGEREKCCDEMAIAQLGAKAKDYSNAIVNTLRNEYESAWPVPSLAVAGPVRNIEDRIKTIMKPGKKFYTRPSLMALTVVLLLALLVAPTVLVLTARAGTKAGEAGRIAEETVERAEGVIERDADTSEPPESSKKVTCLGKVVDTQGRPIVGAKVTAYEMHFDGFAGNFMLHQVGEVTTAEDGAFTFTTDTKPEKSLRYQCYIVATKQDLALDWTIWKMREDIESNIELGKPAKLEGVIVDEAGKPVVGVEVRANLSRTLETAGGEEKNEWLPGIAPLHELGTQTDGQGEFIFTNLPGDLGLDLLVTAAGKATTYTYQLEPRGPAFKTGQTDVRVVLPAEARIEGKIVHPDTGKGIARTKFAVVDSSGLFYYRLVYTTDDDGTFSIGGLQTGQYLIRNGGFPNTYVDVKSGKTTKLTVQRRSKAQVRYFHILLEHGSPAVLKPEQKIIVRFEENEGVRNVGHIDVDGYLKAYLSQREYRQWQLGKGWFAALIPNVGGKSFRREEIFSYDDLIKDWPKTIKAKEAMPKDESDLLVGKSLPGMKDFGIDLLSDEINDKMILVCFWDMNQRPSRRLIMELAKREKELEEKSVVVLLVHTSDVDVRKLQRFLKSYKISFTCGSIKNDTEKVLFRWGVRAQPWLVLTNEKGVVRVGGFGLEQLDDKLREKDSTQSSDIQESVKSDKVVLKLIDSDGRPVAGAKVGTNVETRDVSILGRKLSWNLRGREHNISNEWGEITLTREKLFTPSLSADRKLALYVLHEDRRIGATCMISKDGEREEIKLALVPVCRVHGKLDSEGLKKIGRPLTWANVYLFWDRDSFGVLSHMPDNKRFEFFVPPDRYTLNAYGSGEGASTKSANPTFEVTANQSELDLGIIDLPPTKVTSLIGKPAPELGSIKSWKNGPPLKLVDLRGKLVILHFSGGYPSTSRDLPRLVELHEEFENAGLVIISLYNCESMKQLEERFAEASKKFGGESEVPFRSAVVGGKGRPIEGTDRTIPGDTYAAYDISGYPTIVLINREGKIAEKLNLSGAKKKLENMLGVKVKPALPTWRQRFNKVYFLEEGQVLKRIAPPFIPERKDYYFEHVPGQARAIPDGPRMMTFSWDGKLNPNGMGFGGVRDLTEPLDLFGLESYEDDGPEELLSLKLPGDWIVRTGTTIEERMRALQQLLAEELGRDIRFEKRAVECQAIVATGNFKYHRLPVVQDDRCIHIYSDDFTPDGSGGGGSGTVDSVSEFLQAIGDRVVMPVIDQTESSEEIRIPYRHHRSAYLSRIEDPTEKTEKLQLLLDNISRQTNLQFTVRRRPVEKWFVTEGNKEK